MDKKTIGTAALTSLVVVLLAWMVIGGGPQGPAGQNGRNGQNVGAVASPEIPSPYIRWGSVATYRGATDMQTATTTLCAIQGPAATSTLTFAGWKITAGTSTAATIDIGIGRTAYATSTTLVTATSVASGANGEGVWSDVTGTTGVMRPGDYLIVKTAGAGLGGYTYTGTCVAEFTVL